MSNKKRQRNRSPGSGLTNPSAPASHPVRDQNIQNTKVLRYRWAFLLATVILVPLGLLLALELGLRLIHYGDPTGFFLRREVNSQRMSIDNQKFTRRFFPRALMRHPQPFMFPVPKANQGIRIFVLGESAAMGDPEPAFGLARVLEVLLRERYRDRQFEVINTGITAINSHVILPIAQDCATQQGDLWVIYMGHNEVVGPFGAGTVFGAQVPSLNLIRTSLALKATRTGQWLSALLHQSDSESRTPRNWGGMEMFLNHQVSARDPRLGRVYASFQSNLEDLLQTGVRAGVRIIVSSVASNLKDCAPFASLHRPDLTADDLARWETDFRAGAGLQEASNHVAALEHFQVAARLDAEYADLAYRQGHCCWELGRFAEALKFFETARDLDALRFRADTRINELLRRAAEGRTAQGIVWVDSVRAVAQQSPQGVAGNELLLEHVHPTFEGNYWIARALAEPIAAWLGAGTGSFLSLEECARRLALTGWDRFQILETMGKRRQKPPFTAQSDWKLQNEHWTETLDKLRPLTKGYALKRAVIACREELERWPGDGVLRSNYARLLQAAGESEQAMAQWRQVIRQAPYNPIANYALGHLLDSLGRSADAAPYFTAALRLRNEFHEAWNGLGLCWVNLGQWDEALRCYQEALRLNPNFVEGHINLGLVLVNQGRVPEARVHFEEALRIDPDNPQARKHLDQSRGQF